MSEYESVSMQFREQLDQRKRSLYGRLLNTEEASAAIGLSCYELRRGGKEGRYPVILCGSPGMKFRKMKWNLEALENALRRQQMDQYTGREDDC